jgi:hypothetical protein
LREDRKLKTKRIVFTLVMLSIPVLFALLCVEIYFFNGFWTFRNNFCGSFASLDGELGWIPRPGAESCIKGFDSSTGAELFSSTVRINGDGFRTQAVDSSTPVGGILAIGDSWTFGYGIDWADTFAARLAADHGRPTALLASPAYSGAQAILLAKRHLERVRPSAIVYLDLGFWDRAVCSGSSRPTRILKPCYWVDPTGRVRLVTPPLGWVEHAGRFGLRPGGMMGAGETTLAYFLIARPVAMVEQALVRLGLAAGLGNDFAAWGQEKDLEAIRRANLEEISALASQAGARLVLLDPADSYRKFLPDLPGAANIIYVGSPEWSERVAKPMQALAASDARVSGDGHFGPGTHKLIASLVDEKLAAAR